MQQQRLGRKPLGEVTIDLCGDCQALWFDAFESVQLTPGSTLALFDAIRTAAPTERRPLPTRLPCPRCREPLQLTHDVQKTTHFSYHRCPYGHGRFTPFFQFLQEKDFIRPLPPDELARLAAQVRVIRCSSCGAPVDLSTQTACGYCRAPIAVLDPGAVTRTLDSLAAAEQRRTTIDPLAAVDGVLAGARYQREFERRIGGPDAGIAVDLVGLGLQALAKLLAP